MNIKFFKKLKNRPLKFISQRFWGLLLSCVFTGQVAAQSCVTPPSGLESWWSLDESSGTTALDLSGNGFSATHHNGPTPVVGKVSGGLDFDGSDDFLLSGDIDLPPTFSIDWWQKTDTLTLVPTDYTAMNVVAKDDGGGSRSYFVGVENNGSIVASIRNTGGSFTQYRTDPVLSNGSFEFIVVTYDSSRGSEHRFQFFLNGNPVSGSSLGGYDAGGTPENNNVPVTLGIFSDQSTNQFDGVLDEVEIFNRAITNAEIQAIYNAGSAGKCKPLTLSCAGFQPPANSGPITVKKNRAIPFKAELFDVDGFAITGADIKAAPVIQVFFISAGGGAPIDVSGDTLPAGASSEGNMFVFANDHWQYNLKTSNYSAPGTYLISMESGDADEYGIDPTCNVSFVIE